MSDIITKEQYKKLEELRKEAVELQDRQDALVEEALAITEEGDEGGYTFDYIMNDFCTIDVLLDNLGIKVQK